jgi:small subunit ribosomal protein S2
MPRKKETEIEENKIKDVVETEKKEEELVEELGLSQIEELETSKKGKKEKKDKKEKKISEAKKKLLERAKELGKDLGEKGIKEELKEEIKKSKTSIPVEDYLKYSVYLGTKVITPHMRKFVYKRRADGIAVIDVNLIDTNLREFIKEIVKYNPEDFIIVCKREAGWNAVKLFSELTGVKVFTKKYPAGIITNLTLQDFFEPKMLLLCDPWVDKNALKDAKRMKKKVLALCDTNNYTFNVEHFVPCNNKSNKSLGLIFYLIAKEYLKEKKIDKKLPEIDEFVGEKV